MGNGKIFLIHEGELMEMKETPYEEESNLQEQIAEYTDLLAGDQIDTNQPRRWLLIAREAGIPTEEGGSNHFSCDHFFLDQDGVLTLVEVKRQSDTRLRREVVTQMFDYAANTARHLTVDKIKTKFEDRVNDAQQELGEFLQEDRTVDEFWEDVEANLDRDKLRLLFVADDIPDNLRSVVEFLNDQMDPTEVLAVELSHYEGSSQEALVPRVIGQTESARKKKSSSPRKDWDIESLLNKAEARLGSEIADLTEEIYEWVGSSATKTKFGDGSANPSFMGYWEAVHGASLFVVRIKEKEGFVVFERLQHEAPEERNWAHEELDILVEELNKMNGFETEIQQKEDGRLDIADKIKLTTLAQDNNLEQFKTAIKKFVEACSEN